MDVSEIKEEVVYFGDVKVKEENSSSVVYEVEVTSKVDIKLKKEDPPQSHTSSVTKDIQSAIDIEVKPEQSPASDELELEPEFENTSEYESESSSNEQGPQQMTQSSQTRSIRNKQNTRKKTKQIVKTPKSQIQCPFCPKSFRRAGLLIPHARSKHAAVKKTSSQSTSDDDTLIQCPVCPKFFKSADNVQRHFIRFHVTNKPFQCSVCLESANEIKKFATESFLKRHMKQTHDPTRFKFQCDICSKKFPTPFQCKRHKETHIAKQYKCEYCSNAFRVKERMLKHIIAAHKEYTDRHETFKCDECEQLFGSKKDLDGHVLQTHVEDTVQCKICLKKFTEEGTLNKHLTVAHWENRTWLVCDVCSKTFNNNKDLVKHLEVKHKRFFKCRKCFRSFISEEEYDCHSTERLDEKGKKVEQPQFQCSVCLVLLKTECSFTSHQETHINRSEIKRKIVSQSYPSHPQDSLIKCDFCRKTFVEKSLLLDHATKCHPNRKWKCKSCEKSFQVKFQLNKHELLHSTKKLFECPVCHKGFSNLQYLKDHEAVHKMDKKYKCSRCTKSFHRGASLRQHIANHHGGTKPFKCDICKKSFFYNKDLIRHSLIHKAERPFSCSKCCNSNKSATQLRRHLQITHLVNRGPHLKYVENLVFVCCLEKCNFNTKDDKEVAIHYAKHNLPKVILPRLLDGPEDEVFLSKTTSMNKFMIEARYNCARCLKAFSLPENLNKHMTTFHNGKKTKRRKKVIMHRDRV